MELIIHLRHQVSSPLLLVPAFVEAVKKQRGPSITETLHEQPRWIPIEVSAECFPECFHGVGSPDDVLDAERLSRPQRFHELVEPDKHGKGGL